MGATDEAVAEDGVSYVPTHLAQVAHRRSHLLGTAPHPLLHGAALANHRLRTRRRRPLPKLRFEQMDRRLRDDGAKEARPRAECLIEGEHECAEQPLQQWQPPWWAGGDRANLGELVDSAEELRQLALPNR